MTTRPAIVAALFTAVLILEAPRSATCDDSDTSLTASRDAPVFELAYGPRGQLSIGRLVPLWQGDAFTLDLSALAALEDAQAYSPIPTELGRLVIELGGTWSLTEVGESWFGPGGALALRFGLGLERSRRLGGVETELLLPQPQPGDIPFGGGGAWTTFELGARTPFSDVVVLSLRLRERVFFNAWPLLFGDRAISDDVANFFEEGLSHAPGLDVTLSWRATETLRPLVSLFGEALVPHDRSADTAAFGRLLAGLGIASAGGEVVPFTSLDIGAGKGLLINRHELRFSVGVRFVF